MHVERPTVLHRCGTFVGRTTNWLYDHLRVLPDYRPLVLCDHVKNRSEFPEVEAWRIPRERLTWRLWRRVVGPRPFPPFVRRLKAEWPQILHSHFGYVAYGDLELARELDRPWLVSFYGADVYRLGRLSDWTARYGRVFEESAAVLALGPSMAETLKDLGCPPGKVVVHPLGVDTRSIPSKSRELKSGGPLRILFAGTFREKKGIQYAVRGAALAKDAGIPLELHLAGDATDHPGDRETKAEVLALIEELGMSAVTTHHSWLPFSSLVELALECHVFVAPSVTAADGDAEGTPFVIQQMMATGMPVISTRHSDIPFVFGDKAELLVPERNAEAISQRLQDYYQDPDRIQRDGRALHDRAVQSLDLQHRAAALASLYDRIRA